MSQVLCFVFGVFFLAVFPKSQLIAVRGIDEYFVGMLAGLRENAVGRRQFTPVVGGIANNLAERNTVFFLERCLPKAAAENVVIRKTADFKGTVRRISDNTSNQFPL